MGGAAVRHGDFPLSFRYTISMRLTRYNGVAEALFFAFICASICLSSPAARAQEGALDPAPPKGVTTDEINSKLRATSTPTVKT